MDSISWFSRTESLKENAIPDISIIDRPSYLLSAVGLGSSNERVVSGVLS